MKKNTLFRLLLPGLVAIIFQNCNKEEENNKFQWFKNGNKFYYDLSTDSAFYENYSTIEIIDNRLYASASQNYNSYFVMFQLTDNELQLQNDGIYGLDCLKSCALLNGCTVQFKYLVLPAEPEINDVIPDMFCEQRISRNKTVINVNQLVTIKNFTYKCTVIKDEYGYIEYWDFQYGLIKYEALNNDTVMYTYTLNKME